MAIIESTKPVSLELAQVLSSVNRLKPLSANVTRILRAIEDPNVHVGIIADLILLDQALTAYILRMANSVGLGYASSCTSLHDATMRLGLRQVRALVLSTVAAGPLNRRLDGYRIGSGMLWEHSVRTASIARWLAQAFAYPAPEEAYVAGLLHDIGKLLLDQFIVNDYNKIRELMEQNHMFLWEVEENIYGIDHAGVGGLIAARWEFPEALVETIRFHHAPSLAFSHTRLAAIVNVANAITQEKNELSSFLEGRIIHPEALNVLKIDAEGLEKMRKVMSNSIGASAVLTAPHVSSKTAESLYL